MSDKELKINDTVTKKLSLKGDYKGFNEFYGEHKETIYRSIIKLFGSFKRKDKMKELLLTYLRFLFTLSELLQG